MSLSHHAAIITPRHDGDNPTAFAIYPDSQTWFCFRCQRGGDVIDFVQAWQNLEIKDALAWLANETRITVDLAAASPEMDQHKPCTNVVDAAAGFFANQLWKADGALWFDTWGGASRFDGKTWKSYTSLDGLADNVVESIAVAPDSALWLGTESGVSRFDGKTWQNYTTANGLADNNHIVAWQQGWRRVALRWGVEAAFRKR